MGATISPLPFSSFVVGFLGVKFWRSSSRCERPSRHHIFPSYNRAPPRLARVPHTSKMKMRSSSARTVVWSLVVFTLLCLASSALGENDAAVEVVPGSDADSDDHEAAALHEEGMAMGSEEDDDFDGGRAAAAAAVDVVPDAPEHEEEEPAAAATATAAAVPSDVAEAESTPTINKPKTKVGRRGLGSGAGGGGERTVCAKLTARTLTCMARNNTQRVRFTLPSTPCPR
jgi:hypothetical protein